eukprot:9777948-Heterocapsa_arctica.AAC.1
MAHTVRKDVVMKVMMPLANLGRLGRAGPSVEAVRKEGRGGRGHSEQQGGPLRSERGCQAREGRVRRPLSPRGRIIKCCTALAVAQHSQ